MSQRSGELLLKAIRALPTGEQDELLATLLGGLAASPPTPAQRVRKLVPRAALELAPHLPLSFGQLPEGVGSDQDLRVLPVRLPTGDYERLRGWSKEHDFSMAVIIRTLVERFLDSQQALPNPGEPDLAPHRSEPA